MDRDLLRFLLVVLGVLLVLGIYLWDRYKRTLPSARNRRVIDESPAFDDPLVDSSDEADERRMPPELSDRDDVAGDPPIAEPTAEPRPSDSRDALDPDPDPGLIGQWSATANREGPQMSMGLHFDAHGDNDYLSTDPALQDDVERKLIVIHVASPSGVLAGPAIAAACDTVGLKLGDMSIYHRRDDASGGVVFSVASMVEPGAFPADGMAQFRTPGLAMFTQLPGVRDGVTIYDEMLAVASRLAELLHAEVQDERRNKLTRQMQDHMRESIIEHRRKLRLARSRH